MEWDIYGLVVILMNKVNQAAFYKIYILFGTIFLLLTAGMVSFLFFSYNSDRLRFITVIFIYALAIVILSIIFIVILKSKLTKVIDAVDHIIQDAIEGKSNVCAGYDETSVSSLEGKAHRFVTMSKSTADAISEERNKIKTLISDISHQTKTPISNSLLYSELLLDSCNLSDEEKNLVTGIKGQSEKLKWLIESLVKMSRLETGIISVNNSLVPIFKTISNSIEVVFANAEKKNIQIEVSCDENIRVYHDSKWTSEAITNILENAIKYTRENGQIKVSVTQYEMFARIDILDTGIGIKESELNQIFKRFYRSDEISQCSGVGIGLYLAREIISSQGGYIKVKSVVNEGSIFSVFLPNNA
jgi:signal transduction histidine kinase